MENEQEYAETNTILQKSQRKKVRKRVIVDEEVLDRPEPKDYEPVTFLFFNEEQRGIPVHYEWIDRWIRINECKGIFYDGQRYTLPRIVFNYYKNQCSMPIYANVEQELVPGMPMKASKEVGRTYRFRLEEIRA